MGHACGIRGYQLGGEYTVAESGGEKDIRGRSPFEKVPGNLGSATDAPLGGCGIVVLIPRVDHRAVIKQQLGGDKIASKMKGRATVAALGVD